MKREEIYKRVMLNVDLKQAQHQAELLKGSIVQLESSVQRGDNSAIINDLEELSVIRDRTSSLLQNVEKLVVLDMVTRTDFERIATTKVHNYYNNPSTLRLYILNGFVSSFKLVLVDYLGLTSNYPDYSDVLVKLLSAFSEQNDGELKSISEFFEEQSKMLMSNKNEPQRNQEELRFLLDLLVAMHALSILLLVGSQYISTNKASLTTPLEQAVQMCGRALKNLVQRYIKSAHTQVELLEEIRTALEY